jgi:GLPGLI family protein
MLRNITLLLLTALTGNNVIGQPAKKDVRSGKIIFEISYPESNMDEQRLAMMPKKSILYFKDNMSKAEVPMAAGKMVIISNNKTETATMLMDMMGKKNQIEMSKEDMEKQKSKAKPQVEKTNETKLICGYTCKKAIVTITTAKGSGKFDVWYTNDLKVKNSYSSRIEGIDGFMLEFSSIENGMNIKMTATSVEPMTIDDSEFVIPEGYEKKNLNDLYPSGGKK